MEQIKINTAVAYYRVSSDKQVSQGNGLMGMRILGATE